MKITAKVFKTKGTSSIKANASITLDGAFVVTGLKVVESSKGLFVSMPSYKTAAGEYKDTAFPLSKELRKEISEVILKEYGVSEGDVADNYYAKDDPKDDENDEDSDFPF